MSKSPSICVFCASSNHAPAELFRDARTTGRLLAERDWTLVYGGGSVGLMGELARSVHDCGGRVVGVIPERLRTAEVAYEDSDELIVTPGMAERKTVMIERADAFLHLAGSFGTLDEMLEVITLKLLGYFDKPIVIVNANGFWDPLAALFERFYDNRLAPETTRELYSFADDIDAAFDTLSRALNVS